MKMKNLLGILMLIALVGMAINLSSCSKDDEYSIVGSWKVTDVSIPDEYAVFQFSSNGEGKATLYSKCKVEEEKAFQYTFSNPTLTMNQDGEVTVLTVKWLSTTKFTASSGDGESITFTKQ